MCGIFAFINHENTENNLSAIETSFHKGVARGPEFSTLNNYDNILLGFHRLAINGLTTQSNQPIHHNNVILICNGEIYNFKQLATDHNIELKTNSDCEIILHLYNIYGIEYTLNILDGVFAFILYDKIRNIVVMARDPYGVRPLYYFMEKNALCTASELKVLYNLASQKNLIQNFRPGHYMILNNLQSNIYTYFKKYTNFPCQNIEYWPNLNDELYNRIVTHISKAVKKRVVGTTERPIACLLSGGLDSSLVACLVNREMQLDKTRDDKNKKLQTFSIGLPGSEDLKYARIVAKHLNSIHHEIVVSEDDFFDAIPEVIKAVESYDTTTIRASVGNYLVAKYIKENSDCKVVFNGDGADELMGGYLYMKKAPNCYEFDRECRRLMQDIYMFDVLRSDKSISSHGLEPRTPFLDRQWVEFYLTINRSLRYDTTVQRSEKYLLRKAFGQIMPDLIPEEILWRTKEAFSDGVSSLNKSWYEIIQTKIMSIPNIDIKLSQTKMSYEVLSHLINPPTTPEQCYYRYIFNQHYKQCDHLIEYFWMPKYVIANDASARTLNIYKEKNTNNKKEEKDDEEETTELIQSYSVSDNPTLEESTPEDCKNEYEIILSDEDYETIDLPMSLKLYNSLCNISGFKELNGTSYTDYVKLWKIRRFPNN
jgi:asparagine synthase (glutamine-hydrolysing)